MMEAFEAQVQDERPFRSEWPDDETASYLLREYAARSGSDFAAWVCKTHIGTREVATVDDVEAAAAIVADIRGKFPTLFSALCEMRQEVAHV